MITAVVMVGEGGTENSAQGWVQNARRKAAADLLLQLSEQDLVERVILVSPEETTFAAAPFDNFVCSAPGMVHVGEQLAQLVQEFDISHLLYFGGGSAPLLSDTDMTQVTQQLASAEELVVTNNQFSSDWIALTPAKAVTEWVPRLPRDNMLGWVLTAEGGLPVQVLPASTATRLDIDTPVDLLALRLHDKTKGQLRDYLNGLTLPIERLETALEVLSTPASHVFIAGRLGPNVWLTLNKATRSWLRIVSEERGMISSGRQTRGEVRSLLAAHIEAIGMETYFQMLSEWADAAFIDTRVLLAHHQRWPDPVSRFASDLGDVEHVNDEWLRAFTQAAQQTSIPVILGGHGLMSGAMLAFCDILQVKKLGPTE